jgi:hypothetical protein
VKDIGDVCPIVFNCRWSSVASYEASYEVSWGSCRVGGILLLVMEVDCTVKVRPEYSNCLKEGRGQVFTHTPLGLGLRQGVDHTDSGLLV